ncbi:zinc ribbon domain-containing protein [candidate division WOR-3 bacterium]|nr:zinc ribbon domain-containing protein [candidate division WOR-3 bacterium]
MKSEIFICPFCNYLGRQNEKACPHCGLSLISRCPHCGAHIRSPFAKFCYICGKIITEDKNINNQEKK